jgi:YbbR domain-containing protein
LRLKTQRTATVTIQIAPAPLERTFGDRPVHLRNLASGLSAEAVPSAVDVALRGSRDILNRIDPDEVTAFVDLAGLGVGQYNLTVHVEAREAGLSHVEPAAVQVRIASVKD